MSESETEILRKLDTVILMLGHQVSMLHENIETKAIVLSSLGLKPAEIARICGTTPGTISTRLTEAKKKGRKSKKSR